MRTEIHGARVFIKAETKKDLTDLMRVIKHFPEADQNYWLVLDTSEVDTSCDVQPIRGE